MLIHAGTSKSLVLVSGPREQVKEASNALRDSGLAPAPIDSMFSEDESSQETEPPQPDKFATGEKRLTVIRAIFGSLYPRVALTGDDVGSFRLICDDADRTEATDLLSKLVSGDEKDSWAILGIPSHIEPAVGATRLQNRNPELKLHLSTRERKLLAYGPESAIRKFNKSRDRNQDFEGQFALRNMSPEDASIHVRAMFPGAYVTSARGKLLVVSCTVDTAAAVVRFIDQLLSLIHI